MTVGQADLDRIRGLPLFAGASAVTFEGLAAEAAIQRCPPMARLLDEGQSVDFLYVLLSGAIELEGTWNEKETTLAIARPMFAFPLSSVVLDRPALFSVLTLERADVLLLPAGRIRAAMREDAGLAAQISVELAGTYRALTRALKNQKLRGGLERLANYLLSLRADKGGADTVTLPHEKRRLASLLGMTPENLSRAFASLSDHGVIVRGRAVSFSEPEALDRLAKPDPLIDVLGGDKDDGEGWRHGGSYAA